MRFLLDEWPISWRLSLSPPEPTLLQLVRIVLYYSCEPMLMMVDGCTNECCDNLLVICLRKPGPTSLRANKELILAFSLYLWRLLEVFLEPVLPPRGKRRAFMGETVGLSIISTSLCPLAIRRLGEVTE